MERTEVNSWHEQFHESLKNLVRLPLTLTNPPFPEAIVHPEISIVPVAFLA